MQVKVTDTIALPHRDDVDGPLPNAVEPSDHIMIGAVLQLKTKDEIAQEAEVEAEAEAEDEDEDEDSSDHNNSDGDDDDDNEEVKPARVTRRTPRSKSPARRRS